MRGTVSVLVRGTVKSLKWRSVFTKALHHSVWSPVTPVLLWGPLEDLYADDLVIIAESLEECVRRLLTWKEAIEEKGLRVNAGKRKICGMGLDLLQSSGEFRLSHWSRLQQHLLQRLQALGVQEMQWAQVLDKGPWLQMYMVPGNCTPLGRQTTKGSSSWTWQAGGGSFLLLPRRHALSSWLLWTFNHNVWKPPGRS